MIKVLFFAQIRELLGVSELEISENEISVKDLLTLICEQNKKWQKIMQDQSLLASVNHQLVDFDFIVHSEDEVAFFPPVTGG